MHKGGKMVLCIHELPESMVYRIAMRRARSRLLFVMGREAHTGPIRGSPEGLLLFLILVGILFGRIQTLHSALRIFDR